MRYLRRELYVCSKYLDDEISDAMLECYKKSMWEWRKKHMGDTVLQKLMGTGTTRTGSRGVRDVHSSTSPSALTLTSDSEPPDESFTSKDKRKDQEEEETEQSQVRNKFKNVLDRVCLLSYALTE